MRGLAAIGAAFVVGFLVIVAIGIVFDLVRGAQ
jgi:hypothetical protein